MLLLLWLLAIRQKKSESASLLFDKLPFVKLTKQYSYVPKLILATKKWPDSATCVFLSTWDEPKRSCFVTNKCYCQESQPARLAIMALCHRPLLAPFLFYSRHEPRSKSAASVVGFGACVIYIYSISWIFRIDNTSAAPLRCELGSGIKSLLGVELSLKGMPKIKATWFTNMNILLKVFFLTLWQLYIRSRNFPESPFI